MIISLEPRFEIPMTYRNVLPKLWFLYLALHMIKTTNTKYHFGGDMIKQYHLLHEQIKDNNRLPNKAGERCHQNKCNYCGGFWEWKPDRDGDHIISKKRWDPLPLNQRKLFDLPNFRVTACDHCNPSKWKRPMLVWYVEHKNKSPLDISVDLIQIYCKAEWRYAEIRNTLDNEVDECHKKVITQLHLALDDSSYNVIWAAPKGLDRFC